MGKPKPKKYPQMQTTEYELANLARLLASDVAFWSEALRERKLPSADLHDIAEVSEQSHRLRVRFEARVKARQKARNEWAANERYAFDQPEGKKEPPLPHEPFGVRLTEREAQHLQRAVARQNAR